MKTTSGSRKPRNLRREYDIARRVDGQYGIYRWMACPITPPLMSTPKGADQLNAADHGIFEPVEVHIHRRWVIVAVRQSFKAALKWTRAQQKEARDAAAA